MIVLAGVGRYPLVVKAAMLLCKFWNRLVEMDDGRLVKQALLHSAALRPLTRSNSNHKSWAGQVATNRPVPIRYRLAMRSQLSTDSECQCGGEAAEQLPGVGECMPRCHDAPILEPEMYC